jgi:hypothetical protein
LAVRNVARCGLFAQVAHTRFWVALQTALSNAPSVHVVQGMQVATVVWRVAVE